MKPITIADNEAYLRQVSSPADIKDKDLQQEISVLSQFCKENDVMAMAAIQLGMPKRIVYLKNTDLTIVNKMQTNSETDEEKQHDEERVLINPVIIKREGLTDYWESCASCLDNMGHVKRPYRIVVEYLDISGEVHTDTFEGFESTVLSHEMDHLDGILHMDIAEEVLVMPKEERKMFRQNHGYNVVFTSGDYEELLKVSGQL